MAHPELAERLTRLNAELAQCQPDGVRRSEQQSHHWDVDFQNASRDLKRRKLMYLAAQSELQLLKSLQESDLGVLEHSNYEDRERVRIAAKNELRELKGEVQKEIAAKQQLYKEISQLFEEHGEDHERCARDLRAAQQMQANMEDEDQEVQAGGSLLPVGMNLQAELPLPCDDGGVLSQGAQSLAGLRDARVEEVAKQGRQQFEAQCLRKTLSQAEARHAELERLEREARAKVIELEQHKTLEEEFGLGLPIITFDDSAGTVTLGWPSSMSVPSDDDVAVRTVSVEFDEQGRLVRAQTHATLQLYDEAATSVDTDDLARLLTLVWDRVCQQSDGLQPGSSAASDGPHAEACELGGA